MTEKARRVFRDSFDQGHECDWCPRTEIDQSLPAAERRRMGDALYRAHMTRLSHRRQVMTRQVVEAGQELARIEDELHDVADAV